jgi:hypothetical protein
MSELDHNVERHRIADALRSLPDEQLLAVLQEVFSFRRPNPEEDRFNQNRYFLGTSSRLLESGEGEPDKWGSWKFEAVAYIDRNHYPAGNGPDYGLCQFGACSTCGIRVRSNVKNGVCPICSTKVSMT